jgi:hypothetical protein
MQPGGGFEMTSLRLRRDAEFGKGLKIRCPDSRSTGTAVLCLPVVVPSQLSLLIALYRQSPFRSARTTASTAFLEVGDRSTPEPSHRVRHFQHTQEEKGKSFRGNPSLASRARRTWSIGTFYREIHRNMHARCGQLRHPPARDSSASSKRAAGDRNRS